MKVITRASLAAEAAERWKKQYQRPDGTWPAYPVNNPTIYFSLVGLGPTPNPDSVDEIIGNSSWTHVSDCDECEQRTEVLVQVGQKPDYESATAYVCPECLAKALAMVQPSLSQPLSA